MTIGTHDVVASFAYHITIDGVPMAQFQKVDGISIEVQAIEYRAMSLTEGPILRKSPGLKKYGDITLSRGKVQDKDFWDWIKKAQAGDLAGARKSGSIILMDYNISAPITTFNFSNAWPTKVSLGGLAAGSNDVLLETIVLCVEKLELA
jgi:phage tail-like protein